MGSVECKSVCKKKEGVCGTCKCKLCQDMYVSAKKDTDCCNAAYCGDRGKKESPRNSNNHKIIDVFLGRSPN